MPHHCISLREANQNFSRLMAAVERGEVYCITRRGRQVAWLTPSNPLVAQNAKPVLPAENGPAIPLTELALATRLSQLEALVDKLLSALASTSHRQ